MGSNVFLWKGRVSLPVAVKKVLWASGYQHFNTYGAQMVVENAFDFTHIVRVNWASRNPVFLVSSLCFKPL